MTKSAKKSLLYLAVFSLFTVASVVLRTVALELELESSLIYFDDETLITASSVIAALFVLFSFSYLFTVREELSLYASFETPQTYIPSGAAAVALFFLGGELFGKMLFSERYHGAVYFSGVSSVITLASAILAIVCAVNFFLNVFQEKKESTSRAVFCLLCAAFLGCYAGYLFFSDALPINAPNKATDQLAYLALSVFFLYETRISLGRAMWKLYFVFGLIAASLSFFSAVPSLIFYFTRGEVISNSLAENVLTLILGIYVTCRISLVVTLVPDGMCETVKVISDMAKSRSDEIKSYESRRGVLGPLSASDESKISSTDVGANYEIDIPGFTKETPPDSGFIQQSINFDETDAKE